MRTTQRKGDTATTQAIASFTRLGWDVALPVTESAAYDLIVDNGRLHRVQCKYSADRHVDLRRIHSNATGLVVKRIAAHAYDWLYVLRPDGEEYLVRACHSGRRSVTMQPEYLLGAVAESGLSQLP